jgi:hypothetical protein
MRLALQAPGDARTSTGPAKDLAAAAFSVRSFQLSDSSVATRRARAWASAWVSGVLGIAAALAVGFGLLLAANPEDTEAIESPLLLAVARQLSEGPWGLYGPFSGRNPLVLIHAPLYYHLAALGAWPLVGAGVEPVKAALLAGRSLSILGLFGTLLVARALSRLDGAPQKTGWWAAFLVAATVAAGGTPFEVRPDMLGVFLQSASVLFVLAALRSAGPGKARLDAAMIGFALAFCVKQTFVMPALISAALVLAASRRGVVEIRPTARGILLGLLVVLGVYGSEELATGGRMSQAVFVAAAHVPEVHPAGWFRATIVANAIFQWCIGLLALLTAAGAARVASRRGLGWKTLEIPAALLIPLFLALVSFEHANEPNWQRVLHTLGVAGTAVLAVPVYTLLQPAPRDRSRLDAVLWLYLIADLALTAFLSWSSTGAWVNYAIQPVVFLGVIAALSLTRAIDEALSYRSVLIIALAVTVPLLVVFKYVYRTTAQRLVERSALRTIFQELQCTPPELFFVDRPGDNRLHGRMELVYDDWLYPVFESLHLAEPRSIWLRRALRGRAVGYVIAMSDSKRIPALSEPLVRLGYVPSIQVGPFYVWKHVLRGND